MSDNAFDKVIVDTLAFEGGYVFDTSDPGGETNFGISKRSYPDVDIVDLTRDGAIAIYRRDFWDRPALGTLPDMIAAKLFDLSVNMGLRAATKILQLALWDYGDRQLVDDGVLGPATRSSCHAAPEPLRVVALICARAEEHYKAIVASHPVTAKYLHGWLRRAAFIPEV